MGDRGVGVAVFLLCSLAVISGLALGADVRNASSRKSLFPSLPLDKRKRDGNTEVVIEHVGGEGSQEHHHHPPVDWLVILAIIIALLLLVLLCIVISRLSEPNTKYKRLHSINSSSSNPAQAFTYIDLSNGEFPCSPLPGWAPPGYPCQRAHQCDQPRFAVQYQTTNVNSNTGEVDDHVYSQPIPRMNSDIEQDPSSVDTCNEAPFQPQAAPRQIGSSGLVPRSPERTASRETLDSPTGFEPPEKRMRSAESPLPQSTFESTTLKEARDIQVHTLYPGVGVAVSSRRLVSASRASVPTPHQRGPLPAPFTGSLPDGGSVTPPDQPGASSPAHHLPPTDDSRPRTTHYLTYSPPSPEPPALGSFGSPTLEVSGHAPAGESSSSPSETPDDKTVQEEKLISPTPKREEPKTEPKAQSKLPIQSRPVSQFPPRFRQSPRKKRTPSLITRKVTLTPSGTRSNAPKPSGAAPEVRIDSTGQGKKTLEPSSGLRDVAHSEEVVPHPGRAEEIKRTGASLPERSHTTSAVSPQQPSTETPPQFSTSTSRLKKLFEDEAAKAVKSTPKHLHRGRRRSSPKKASVALLEWEPPQTADIKPKESAPPPVSVVALDEKKPEVKPRMTDNLRSPSTTSSDSSVPQSESLDMAGALSDAARTPEHPPPVHRPDRPAAKPADETALQARFAKEQLVLPSPPLERPLDEKPRRQSRQFEESILVTAGRLTRKKPDDQSSTEPFSVEDTAKRHSTSDIPSDAYPKVLRRSSISGGQSEGILEQQKVLKTPTPPQVAPRSRSSLSSPQTADDSGTYYLDFELRPSIEYLPQQAKPRSVDALSSEEETRPRTAPTPPTLRTSVESPSPRGDVPASDMRRDVIYVPSPDHSPPNMRVVPIVEPEEPFCWPKETPNETPRRRSAEEAVEPTQTPTPRKRSIDISTGVLSPWRQDDVHIYHATSPKPHLPEPGGVSPAGTPTPKGEGKAVAPPEEGGSETPARTPEERFSKEKPGAHLLVPEAQGKDAKPPGLVTERESSRTPQEPADDTFSLYALSRLGDVERDVIQPVKESEPPRPKTSHAASPAERLVVEEVIVPSHLELLYPSEPSAHQTPESKPKDGKDAPQSTLDSPREPTVVPAVRKTSRQWQPADRARMELESKVWPPKPEEGQDSRRTTVGEWRLATVPSPGPVAERHPTERAAVVVERQLVPAEATFPIAEIPVAEAPEQASDRDLETRPHPADLAKIPAKEAPEPARHGHLEIKAPPPHPPGIPADQAPVSAEEGRRRADGEIAEITSGKLPLLAEEGHIAALQTQPARIPEVVSGRPPELYTGQLIAAEEYPSKIAEITPGKSMVLAEQPVSPMEIAVQHDEQRSIVADVRQPAPSVGSPAKAARPALGEKPLVPVPEAIQQLVESLREISTEAEYNPEIPHEGQQAPPITDWEAGSTTPVRRSSGQHGIETEHREEPRESSGTPSDSTSDTTSSESERKMRIQRMKPPKTDPTHPLYSSSIPLEQERQDIEGLEPAAERLELVHEIKPSLPDRPSHPALPSLYRPSIEYVPALSLEQSTSGSNDDASKPFTIGSGLRPTAALGSPQGQLSPSRKKGQTVLMSGTDILEAPVMDPDTTRVTSSPSFSSPYRSHGRSLEQSPLPPGSPRLLPNIHRAALTKSAQDSDLRPRVAGPVSEQNTVVPVLEAGSTKLVSRPAGPRSVVSKSVEDVRQPTAAVPQTSASGTTRQQMSPGPIAGGTSRIFLAAPSPVTAPGSRDLITWKTPSPSGAHASQDVSNVSAVSDVTAGPTDAPQGTEAPSGAKTGAKKME